MKILKFGGKSLANGEGLQKVVQTIAQKYFNNEPIAVVVSARGNATDELVILLKKAQANINFQADFEQFKKTIHPRHFPGTRFFDRREKRRLSLEKRVWVLCRTDDDERERRG
jgi:aspartokinase